jgi:hypothetical protein
MKMLPQVLFWLGLISIPFAWLVWYVGPQMEMVRPVLASISDPALRAALQEAHAERLGIWVRSLKRKYRNKKHVRYR